MHLNEYLTKHGMTSREFARRLGQSIFAVRKWRQGVSIPRQQALLRIETLTRGKVSAKDWYKR